MADLDLTEALEAADDAWDKAWRIGADEYDARTAAVRAAVPHIARQVREQAAAEIDAEANRVRLIPKKHQQYGHAYNGAVAVGLTAAARMLAEHTGDPDA